MARSANVRIVKSLTASSLERRGHSQGSNDIFSLALETWTSLAIPAPRQAAPGAGQNLDARGRGSLILWNAGRRLRCARTTTRSSHRGSLLRRVSRQKRDHALETLTNISPYGLGAGDVATAYRDSTGAAHGVTAWGRSPSDSPEAARRSRRRAGRRRNGGHGSSQT